jgi:hypothetical protein
VPTAPADADSCQTSAFPAKSATSTSSRVDYAAAMRACSVAATAGTAAAPADDSAPPVAGAPEVSNSLSVIKASKLTMSGLTYDGLSTLQSPAGPVTVMTFGADEVDIEDIDQTYPFTGGQTEITNPGSTAVLKGNVRLYVTKLAASIFGLIPLTFTPSFQPPLVLSSMFFTDATTDVALVQCDQILLPKLALPVRAQ